MGDRLTKSTYTLSKMVCEIPGSCLHCPNKLRAINAGVENPIFRGQCRLLRYSATDRNYGLGLQPRAQQKSHLTKVLSSLWWKVGRLHKLLTSFFVCSNPYQHHRQQPFAPILSSPNFFDLFFLLTEVDFLPKIIHVSFFFFCCVYDKGLITEA